MKKLFSKKHLASIITILLFSFVPQFVSAQNGKGTKCNKIFCPSGYICVNGVCKRYFPWLTDSSTVNGSAIISPADPNTPATQHVAAQNIQVKSDKVPVDGRSFTRSRLSDVRSYSTNR
jgi:hypothetical protein